MSLWVMFQAEDSCEAENNDKRQGWGGDQGEDGQHSNWAGTNKV